MAAPTIPVSAEEHLRDLINIRTQILMLQLIFLQWPLVDIAKAENASLRARIKTTKAIKKITHKRER
nr:hypothetical protein [Tanacetum cinerariifolium]